MAYATAEDVAAYMNRPLTSNQLAQAAFFLDAASAWIDQQTGRTWNPSSPTTEVHPISGTYLYVNRRPIASVSQVRIRPSYVGASWTTITASVGYEVVDAAKGLIKLGTNIGLLGVYDTVEVTYTHTASVPSNIKLVAILLAAYKLNASLNPIQQRVRSMNDNRAMSVTFRNEEIPPEVQSLLPPKQVYIV